MFPPKLSASVTSVTPQPHPGTVTPCGLLMSHVYAAVTTQEATFSLQVISGSPTVLDVTCPHPTLTPPSPHYVYLDSLDSPFQFPLSSNVLGNCHQKRFCMSLLSCHIFLKFRIVCSAFLLS